MDVWKTVIFSKSMLIADSLSIEVENENSWWKAEKDIEPWMLQSKKEIIVKLTILYKKTWVMNAENSDDEALSSKKVHCRNVTNNRIRKQIPKACLKRHKSRVKLIANVWIILCFVEGMDRVHVQMRGAFATLLTASIFDYWRNIWKHKVSPLIDQ